MSVAPLECDTGDRDLKVFSYNANVTHTPLRTTFIEISIDTGSFSEEWWKVFENVTTVVFCVALSDYDLIDQEAVETVRVQLRDYTA